MCLSFYFEMKLSPRNFTEGPVVFDNMAEGMTDLMLQVFFTNYDY